MAWTAPSDRTTGDIITAAEWNDLLGATGDMSLTAPGVVTTAGDITYASAANTLARLGIGATSEVLTVTGGVPVWAAAASGSRAVVGQDTAESTYSTNVQADIVTVAISPSITAAQGFRITGRYRKGTGDTAAAEVGIKINSTLILSAAGSAVFLANTTATNQAEDGYFVLEVSPRSATYTAGAVDAWYMTRVTATRAVAKARTYLTGTTVADVPTADITSITITGKSGHGSITMGIKDVLVEAIG